jgi:3' exoribonuclease, RNase T-like
MSNPLSVPNCMIDLETLDTDLTSQVLSIGACKFNENGIIDKFYINLKIKEGAAFGFTISKETLKWWKEQRQEVIDSAIKNAVGYVDGVDAFLNWYGDYSMPTWSNGADFDIPIMKHHFTVLQKTIPWKYKHTRCYRTTTALLGDLVPIQRTGMAHCSVDDSVSQTEHLIQILK